MVKVQLKKKNLKTPIKKRGQKKCKKKRGLLEGIKKTPSWKKRANLKTKKKGGHALQFQNQIFGALILYMPNGDLNGINHWLCLQKAELNTKNSTNLRLPKT